MASNLASLIGVIGAGMAGYARGKEQNAQNEIRQEQIEDRRRQRADAEALRRAGADIEPQIKEAAGNMGPSAVMVGKQAYGTEGEAQSAADQQNTPQAKIQRQMGALITQGRPDTALDLDEKAMKHRALGQKLDAAMKAEGISDFIDGNMVRAPRVEDVEAGKAGVFDFNSEDVKKFNAVGGKVTIGEGQKGRWTTFTHPNGRKVVDFEVIDAEGKPVAPSARAIQLIAQMSAQSRDELADKQFEQGKRISVAQQNVDINKDYKDGMLDVARDRAQTYENGYGKNGNGGASRDKMSEVDKEEFDMHKADAQKIREAIMRAQAEGTWEPQTNETQRALMLQGEIASRKAQGILSRYRSADSGSEQPKADPLGIRGKVGGQPAAQGQTGAPMPESGQGGGSDRFRIINAELQKAMQSQAASAPGSDDWRREAANVESLKQEIGRLPMSERGQVARPPQGQPKAPGKTATAQSSTNPPAAARQKIPAIAEKGVLEMLLPTPQGGSKAQSLRDQKNQDRDRMIQQAAAQQGFAPTESFGNGGMLRKPERMYINPKTGERRWESQLVDLE